ncbi:hypothetical protein FOA52_001982 [Chlamydomonas sp. UWO 241]|nr:hypothetical protein FOA52_001982 [Chlamydomonas sp. UWO 241]
MAATPSQPLPPKEQALFRSVVKHYEAKAYKKAIKAADAILKKFAEHGETLAMKGLTINSQVDGAQKDGKKEEAYELVRRGLKADLRSHVTWHVYGLLYRSDREYREAIKCYLNALRIDKENAQILRDLANLQVQMRDLSGYVDTRHTLLTLKPSNRNNWISFAVAHHINKNHTMAVEILESYEKTLEEVPSNEAYEHSEMLMYKSRVLEEGGRLQEALEVLELNDAKIRDRWGRAQSRASLLLRLGQASAAGVNGLQVWKAEAAYRALIELNPDHYRMHEGLQAALGLRPAPGAALTDDQRTRLGTLYKDLQELYPRSSACRRIPLDCLTGAAFEAALADYCKKYLIKGVPSLFVDLLPLYADAAKVATTHALFERWCATLRTGDGFGDGTGSEVGQAFVWTLLFLAQSYNHAGRFADALKLADEAILVSPSTTEGFSIKGKILAHAGCPEGAAHLAEAARRGDLGDRYLNSMAVRALLDAGRPDAADLTAGLFVRDDAGAPPSSVLYDMQHMWYEVAAGDCHWRLGDLSKALKKYVAVTKHFDDIHEDQFDFHGYCMRKMTLRAYIDMLNMEDKLYGSDYYSQAATGAITAYLALHDAPKAADAEADEEAKMKLMSADEKKKYKLKKKKEEKNAVKAADEKKAAEEAMRVAREAAAKAAAAATGDKKKTGGGPAKEKDADPDGAKLAATADPLGEATKLVVMLKEHAGARVSTQLAAFGVYRRKGRLLLALAAVTRAAAASDGGPGHPDVHVAVVRLAALAAASPPANPAAAAVLSDGVKALLAPSTDAVSYAKAWQAEHAGASGGVRARIAAATAAVALDGSVAAKAAALALVTGSQLTSVSHADAVAALAALTDKGSPLADEAAAAAFNASAAKAFPYSASFGGDAQVTNYEVFQFDGLLEAFGKLSF